MGTYDVFGGSIHKETDFECLKDGCLCIEEGSKGKEIISCDATRIDNNSSGDNQHEDQSFNKVSIIADLLLSCTWFSKKKMEITTNPYQMDSCCNL